MSGAVHSETFARRVEQWGCEDHAVVFRRNISQRFLLAARHVALLTFTQPLLVPDM
jgi:hypothetical protein